MINLMYLVLTALLALNVSAEVMNAFFSLDKGMKDSGAIVDNMNEALMGSIDKQADAYKNDNNEKYRQNAKQAKVVTDGFISYIEQIRKDDFRQLRRLDVRPGITGMWQIRGRSDISFVRLVKWDMWYINNWSLWLDLNILFQTIPVVIKGKGAY